ncbi:MAG: hypothetical protein ACTHQQ_07455 [Solirubrobacteraceae bacterium]
MTESVRMNVSWIPETTFGSALFITPLFSTEEQKPSANTLVLLMLVRGGH